MNNTAFKITPFPQTPYSQENEVNEKNSVSNSVSESLTTGARACARTRTREEEREEHLEQIAGYYCETFGAAAMPPIAKRQCLIAMNQGLDPMLIYTAIDEAALAPRPSWAYAAAILRRLAQEGCLTTDAYLERQERWQARRRGGSAY